MKKLAGFTVLLMFPALFAFAGFPDGPRKSVTSQIRVIIPPFALIRLADNTLKAIPLNAFHDYLKQSNVSRVFTDQAEYSANIESNQNIITGIESKRERTPSSLQITTTYTSTHQ